MNEPNRKIDSWKPAFFGIWTGQAFSLAGSRIAQFALIWWVTQLTGSATVLATASLVALIPEIVLSPIAGAYVDRWNRRLIMIVADGLIGLVSLWLAYLFWTGSMQVWHVYVIMFIRALGSSFHWPAMQASTSLMVPKEQLTRVAGLNQTLNGALNIVGPPLGALLMDLLPLQGVMLIDVATALLAILPLLIVRIPEPQRDSESQVQTSVWSDIRQGLDYLRGWRGLMILIGMSMIVKIALTPAFSLLPLLVSSHFQRDAAQLGLLEAIVGGGIVVGGLLLTSWGGFRKKILTIMMGVIILGAALTIMGLTPAAWFALALASAALLGLAIPIVDGPVMAILQAGVAPEMQGRVFTLMSSLIWITSPISLALAGPISDWLGLQIWYLVAGVLCLVIAVAGLFMPALLRIEENNQEQAAESLVAGR